jgi:beta-glucosidase
MMQNNIKFIVLILLAITQFACQPAPNRTETTKPTIEAEIDAILAQMTLEEKIGQMSQVAESGEDGPGDIENEIRNGNVGSFLNIFDLEKRNRLQKIAIEESRLGIPVIFGADVIHGQRTIFPVPLGEAASWNLDLMEKTAAVAARPAMGPDCRRCWRGSLSGH